MTTPATAPTSNSQLGPAAPPEPPDPPDPPEPLAPPEPVGPAGPLAPPDPPDPPVPPEPPRGLGRAVSVSPGAGRGPVGPTAPPWVLVAPVARFAPEPPELPAVLGVPASPGALGAAVAVPLVVVGAVPGALVNAAVLDMPEVLDGPLAESDPHAASSGIANRAALVPATAENRRSVSHRHMPLFAMSSGWVFIVSYSARVKWVARAGFPAPSPLKRRTSSEVITLCESCGALSTCGRVGTDVVESGFATIDLQRTTGGI